MTPDAAEERKAREREFHDSVFADGARGHLATVYDGLSGARTEYRRQIARLAPGRSVLEYGCGPGSHAFMLAPVATKVTGIDISPVAIEQANSKAKELSLSNVDFAVMDAEKLEVPDASVDLVCGTAILHHLDLERSYSELRRVLKPGGSAVFLEPFAYHPAVFLYRLVTPGLRTPDEHPLRYGDIKLARSTFSEVRLRHFNLFTVAIVPLLSVAPFRRTRTVLEKVDAAVLGGRSPLRWLAWQAVIEFDR